MATPEHTGSPLAVVGAAFLLAVVANAIAWTGESTVWIVATYHFGFAIGVCVVLPTWYQSVVCRRPLAEIGLTLARWKRDVAIGLGFVLLTVTPRLGELDVPALPVLGWLTAAMCLSTLFEEVFFRGFLQSKVRSVLGALPAIVISGLAFSLYHVGYGPEWRDPAKLVQLTFVGIMFAVAFQTTSSVLTSFTLNLPHAVVTFIEDGRYFGAGIGTISLVAAATGLARIAHVARLERDGPALATGRAP